MPALRGTAPTLVKLRFEFGNLRLLTRKTRVRFLTLLHGMIKLGLQRRAVPFCFRLHGCQFSPQFAECDRVFFLGFATAVVIVLRGAFQFLYPRGQTNDFMIGLGPRRFNAIALAQCIIKLLIGTLQIGFEAIAGRLQLRLRRGRDAHVLLRRSEIVTQALLFGAQRFCFLL